MKSPPFCPNSQCTHHQSAPRGNRWFWRAGHYYTDAFGFIQRFLCLRCSHRFSAQSFSIDYYAKRRVDYHQIETQLKSTGSVSDLSRDLSVSTDTITNRIGRLARNALAIHAALRPKGSLHEDLVADGFESFCVSQYFPDNTTLLVGKQSQYLYFANYCTLRRKGRMTETQKHKRERLEKLWKADPKAIRRAFDEVVEQIVGFSEPRILYTDEKWEYAASVREMVGRGSHIAHCRISSQLPRTVSNDLFSVNYFDREIRKDCANHVRETVCFARNVNNCMDRLWVYFVYHNYRKPYRTARKNERTHAEVAGVDGSAVKGHMRGYYTRRSFLSRTKLRGSMLRLWLRELDTPLRNKAEYLPKYAAA